MLLLQPAVFSIEEVEQMILVVGTDLFLSDLDKE